MDLDLHGWIFKWTNYINGYQRRWFVLQNGMLSYYKNQGEMSHTCRGTINLVNAVIQTEDPCYFVVTNGYSNAFYLKASSDTERNKWVTALEKARAKATENANDGDKADDLLMTSTFDPREIEASIKTLSSKIEDLTTCNTLIVNHGTQLQRSLAELDQIQSAEEATSKMKAINEQTTLFRITVSAMINACKDHLDFVTSQHQNWHSTLKREHDERLALQSMVEDLAKQHSSLEHRARSLVKSPDTESNNHQIPRSTASSSDEEDVFEDAADQFTVVVSSNIGSDIDVSSNNHLKLPSQDKSQGGETPKDYITQMSNESTKHVKRVRRRTIPERPKYGLTNLWGLLKNCVGKDLTKIPMPVMLNEPLSFLQRFSEDFEYSYCLDNAAKCDQWEQMCWVAVFAISSYCYTSTRKSCKPFNPLLGETFEFDRRDDLGWRICSEQVSHHPPTCASHVTGNAGWAIDQETTLTSKFRGKYLQIDPISIVHCKFDGSGHHYTWGKVTTTVHNIIVGRLWVDNHGDIDIVNHKTGDKCHLKFSAYSYFSKDIPRKVTGVVTDKQGTARWVLRGTWDSQMEAAKVLGTSQHGSKPVFETGEYKVIWEKKPPPPHLDKCYNMIQLSVEMNEPEDGVAPTDSRHRPDQRLMENTLWDEANKEKLRLEEKQRELRRLREKKAELAAAEGKSFPEYQPAWFKKTKDPITGNLIHMFTHEYWDCKDKQDFSRCPDIF